MLLTVLLVSTALLIVLTIKRGGDLQQCPKGQHLINYGSQSRYNHWICVEDGTGKMPPILTPSST